MSDYYPYREIEAKWQKFWEETGAFKSTGKGEKYYVLEMFPYPSGYLHMGHVRVYCIGDVIANFMRMKGYDVIHPMGYDAFGMPAENAAIKNKVHPAEWTYKNIQHARGQFKKLGISYDWDREIATCDESYYRWNQWLFIKFFERGLAYRKENAVNWCGDCGTVLANEQVQEGRCWRCENKVVQKPLTQWFFKTTAYSQALLDGHESIDWPERVILMQKNWIGRSEGVRILFREKESGDEIPVFTTRPDTIFGATYMVLAAAHPYVEKIKAKVPDEKKNEIEAFQEKVKNTDITVETLLHLPKEGIDTGVKAVNPVNGREIPIYIGNYVLMDYGTGAIMAVPAHDSRDFAFARKYSLPGIVVIQPAGTVLEAAAMNDAYEDGGRLGNSAQFDGLDNEKAKKEIARWMEKQGIGKTEISYRLKDWLLSRQRYWGTPIPAVYCGKCGVVMESEKNLPVILPKDIEFTGKGNPLESSKSFLEAECPVCGGAARRETDTMDTFVDSSWYFIRYCDAKNENEPVGREKARRELAVDQYVGGPEHACMHLIYARFFTKVMKELGLIEIDEPFKKLLTQGMVVKDGNKMSKSKGNTVSPDDMIEKFGADTARLFMLFAAPPPMDLEWSDAGVEGASRFINRLWRKVKQYSDAVKTAGTDFDYAVLDEKCRETARKTHQTIKKTTHDMEKIQQFNTVVAAVMELFNTFTEKEYDMTDVNQVKLVKFALSSMALMLAPLIPHFAEEMWEMTGGEKGVFRQRWPVFDEDLCREETVEFVIQVSGKIRDRISLSFNAPQEEAERAAFERPKVREWLEGKVVIKKVFVMNKLLNIVVK